MKKNFLMIVAIACMAFSAPTSAFADGEPEQVDLEVTIVDPELEKGGPHKAPPRVPIIFLDDHTLYFDTPCDDCMLQLVDEEDFVVYSVTIPAGTTEWELPEAVTGEFVLQIIRGRYCYWGWIEL